MKKSLLLLCLVCLMGISSCKKTEIIKETTTNTQNNLTIIKTIEANQWHFFNHNNSYSLDIWDTKIDRRAFENDDISVSIMQGISNFYEAIPFVYDDDSYSYIVGVGHIQINLQKIGAQQAPLAPVKMKVKIVLTGSSQ